MRVVALDSAVSLICHPLLVAVPATKVLTSVVTSQVRLTPDVVPLATVLVAAALLGMVFQVRALSVQALSARSTSYVRLADGAVDIVSCRVALCTRAFTGSPLRSKRTKERRFALLALCTFMVVEVPELVFGLDWFVNVSASDVNPVVVIVLGNAATPRPLEVTASDCAVAQMGTATAAITATAARSNGVRRRMVMVP